MTKFNLYARLIRKFRRRPIKVIIFLLIVVYTICVITIIDSEKVSILEAVLMLLPPILGSLDEIEVITPKGITFILSLVIYICFLGLIFGKLADVLINLALKGGVFVKKVNFEKHIVICGWNFQGQKILESLLSSDDHRGKPIVILADMEKIPYDSGEVDFIPGCPWKREDLIRAGIPKADTAIILTDIRGEKTSNPDAEALMIGLAIENLNKKVHTCVQLLFSENIVHLENAKVDEIICLDQIGGNLMVSSALNHGISKVMNELLTFNKGSEIYRYERKAFDEFNGKSFGEVGKQLLDKKMILIAIESKRDDYVIKVCSNDWIHSCGEEEALIINPQSNYKLRENDSLFIISEKKPTKL